MRAEEPGPGPADNIPTVSNTNFNIGPGLAAAQQPTRKQSSDGSGRVRSKPGSTNSSLKGRAAGGSNSSHGSGRRAAPAGSDAPYVPTPPAPASERSAGKIRSKERT